MAKSTSESRPLLSLSTSEKVVSVCVTTGSEVLSSIDSVQWKQRTDDQSAGNSTSIIAMTQAAMQDSRVEPSDFSAIALTNGPGGFTGLRVGVVATRILCYAWSLPVIVVNSLKVSVDKLRRERSLGKESAVWAVTDAQRRQVFASKMKVADNGILKTVESQGLFDRQALVDAMEKGDHVTGSGAFAFSDLIEAKTGVKLPGTDLAACDAIGVSELAQHRLKAGDFDELLSFEPIYFRPSAAEEVRLAKEMEKSKS